MVSLVFSSPSQKSHDILLSLSYLVKDHMILLLLKKKYEKSDDWWNLPVWNLYFNLSSDT
jgi:hypothetical protein